MLYAIAKINGKQHKITEGQELNVDRLSAKVGQKVDIKGVLLVSQNDTKLIGKDAEKATIKASVTAELLGPKVLVFKHKKRKRYRKLVGHRQALSTIKVESIDFPGKKAEKQSAVPAAAGGTSTTQQSAKKGKEEPVKEKEKAQGKKSTPKTKKPPKTSK